MDDDLLDPRQPESVAAVLKVFAILQALSEDEDIGVSELSVRLAMPKAAVYRFLQTMKTLGFVRQEADSERYGLAMKLYELGTKALHHPQLIELAKHRMQMLADLTGETVHLGTPIVNQPVAGLSVSFPTFRFDESKAPGVVALLTAASREISAGLGCTVFPLAPQKTSARGRR